MTKGTVPGANDAVEMRYFQPASAPRSPWTSLLIGILVAAMLLPVVLYLYYGTVRSTLTMTVGPGGLSVRFGVGHIDIPLSDIAAVTYVDEVPRMSRQFGAGTSGLQMGWYRLDGFGRVYRLTTTGRPLVYVDTRPDAAQARPDTRYVFSPHEAERFVELLQTLRTGGASSAGLQEEVVFRPAPSIPLFGDPFMIVMLLVTVPLGIVVVYLTGKGPRSMGYSVGPDGIVIHHLGRRRYRWESVRDVRRIDEPLPRMWCMVGAAMPGYYIGDYRAGQLGSLKVYATRLKPSAVLLETRLGKVLISPEDVDGFLEAVAEYRPVQE